MSLKNRIKKLEKQMAIGSTRVVFFENGTKIEVPEHEYSQMFEQVRGGEEPELYKILKQNKQEGSPDTGGIIYLLEATHPDAVKELWSDHEEGIL